MFPVKPVMLGARNRQRAYGPPCTACAPSRAVIAAVNARVVHCFCRRSELYAILAAKWAGRSKVLGVRRNIGHWHNWRTRWTARMVAALGAEYAANCEAASEFAAKVEWIPRRRVVRDSQSGPIQAA